MNVVNCNSFLHRTVDGVKQFFSPLINASTVVLNDGTRLEKDGKIHADIAADSAKLGGMDASQYATHTNVSAAITDALNAIQNASGVSF